MPVPALIGIRLRHDPVEILLPSKVAAKVCADVKRAIMLADASNNHLQLTSHLTGKLSRKECHVIVIFARSGPIVDPFRSVAGNEPGGPAIAMFQKQSVAGLRGHGDFISYLPGRKLVSTSLIRSAKLARNDHGLGCRKTWSSPLWSRI
jgi:hypothetical protein